MTTYVYIDGIPAVLEVSNFNATDVAYRLKAAVKRGEILTFTTPSTTGPTSHLVNLGQVRHIEVSDGQPPNDLNVVPFMDVQLLQG